MDEKKNITYPPLVSPVAARPKWGGLTTLHALIRDQFHITTWLLLGALLQGLAHLILPYKTLTLLPAFLLLSYKAGTLILTLLGITPNPYKNGVIPGRTTTIFPSEKGTPTTPAGQSICAIMLGVVSHHPLGMLAPGYKEVGDRFDTMVRQMNADASRYGFLGGSAWIRADARTTSNEYAAMLYFENEDYLHAYAHGKMHTETMQWWRENEEQFGSVGIMHEVFACPKNSWEGVYLNYNPSLISATLKQTTDSDGRKVWASPIVRAKGELAYSKGRMGRPFGENEWRPFTATLREEDM